MKVSVKPRVRPTPSWGLVRPSWELLVEHFDQVIFLFLLPSLLVVLGSVLLGDTSHWHHLSDLTHLSQRQRLGIGTMGLGFLWSLINFAPAVYFRAQVAGHKAPGLKECYRRGLPNFWRLVGVNLLFGVLLLIGLVLLIVPGLVLVTLYVRRYYLVNYYIVDRGLTIRQALSQSRQETAGMAQAIWGTIGVQLVFSLMAAIVSTAAVIGVIVGILVQLVCLFVPALRYTEIKRGHSAH